MAKINTHSTDHGNKIEYYGGSIPSIQFNVFPSVSTVDKRRIQKIIQAYDIVNKFDTKNRFTRSMQQIF